MKVLLKKQLPGTGQAGEIVDVADAYVRNYLLPKGLAVVASPQIIAAKVAGEQANKLAKEKQQVAWQEARQRLEGVTIELAKKGHPRGGLFAAVKTQEIKELIEQQYGVKIASSSLTPTSIKQAGQHKVVITWPDHTQNSLTVSITATPD